MRQAYVTDGVNEDVLRREAEQRKNEATFIHRHSYDGNCESGKGCYLVAGVLDGPSGA